MIRPRSFRVLASVGAAVLGIGVVAALVALSWSAARGLAEREGRRVRLVYRASGPLPAGHRITPRDVRLGLRRLPGAEPAQTPLLLGWYVARPVGTDEPLLEGAASAHPVSTVSVPEMVLPVRASGGSTAGIRPGDVVGFVYDSFAAGASPITLGIDGRADGYRVLAVSPTESDSTLFTVLVSAGVARAREAVALATGTWRPVVLNRLPPPPPRRPRRACGEAAGAGTS